MIFETHGKASEYCNRFGLKVRPVDVFDAAISLCNAYNAGRDELTAENAKLREQLAEAMRLLRNVMLAEDKDLYPRIAEVHEWLTDHEA